MKIFFTTAALFLTLISGSSSSQELKSLTAEAKTYYSLLHQAEEALLFEKDTVVAINLYKKASDYYVENIKYGYCEAIRGLVYYNALEGNDSVLYDALVLSIKQNHELYKTEFMIPNQWNQNLQYKSFRESKYWEIYKNSCDSIYEEAVQKLDHQYISQLENLIALDRYNRDIVYPVFSKYNESGDTIYTDVLRTLFIDGDNYVMEKLFDLAEREGFFPYEKVGGNVNYLNLVFTHNLNSCADSTTKAYSSKLDSMLLDMVYRGYYPASMYANLIDRSLSFYCERPQRFGSMMVPKGQRSICLQEIEDIESLDELRANIGLSPYYMSIKKLKLETPELYPVPLRFEKDN